MNVSRLIGGRWPPRGETRGGVNLRTLVAIRWLAVIGQAATLLIVHFSLGYALPFGTALLIVAASAAVNVIATLQQPGNTRLADRDVAAYLAFDVFQVAGLLYLTGGLENPFAVLILAPVTVSATILSRPTTIGLCLFTVLAIVLLGLFRWPLPWYQAGFSLPPTYVLGVGIALVLSTLFIAAYTWQVAAEARRLTDALTATQLALSREQQLSAVGALAAAAAHELGSPLGTIAVVARELARDLPEGPWREDVALLESQVARCRTILAELAQRPERNAPFSGIPLSVLVDLAAAPHRQPDVAFHLDRIGPAEPPEPMVPERPELRHALGNLLQNAFQFAEATVSATVSWDAGAARVVIRDDGPGFPPEVLARIGEPYLSGRDTTGESMGLGIFIAETLLARTGAVLAIENAATGGAEITIRWDRRQLEGLEPPP
ncbi:MAG: ActS/PrrB/RegB family redox-sensitive histidine kinase [Alphaproteobacteria bacterium]|nr:ActS/PrrB/RegB family redox-sensitive histidine kinase [Alphaproteobacteria bacterium]